jgi:hypothetical protein
MLRQGHEVVMETAILKEMIAVIEAEEQRRWSLLTAKDPNFAYDQSCRAGTARRIHTS